MKEASHEEGYGRLRSLIRPALGVALFAVALVVLDRQLHDYTLAEVRARLHAIPPSSIWLAAGLTATSYGVLTLFDVLAIRHLDRHLPYPRVALTSFVAYVFSIDLGLNVFGSSAIRYRLYSMWGLSVADVGGIVAFTTLTYWVGLLSLGGVLLTLWPLTIPAALHVPLISPATTKPIGIALLAALGLYLAVTSIRRRPIELNGVAVRLPRPGMTAAQIGAAAADWIAAASVLWVLLPASAGLDFPTFVTAFLAAQVLGVASTVPAGLGVFEGVVLALLAPYLPAADLLGALVAYRVVYYLLPIFVAVGVLGAVEAMQRRDALARARGLTATVGAVVLPRLLSLAALVSGLSLILGGVAPTAAWHVEVMRPVLALPVVEISHGISVLTGVGLVLLANGLHRRVETSWSAGLVLLAVGVVSSLLRGSHWLIAVGLGALLLSLLACRSYFSRRAYGLPRAVSVQGSSLIAVAALASVWLGAWMVADVEPAQASLSHFHWEGDAARSLRAGGLALAGLAAYATWQMMRPSPPNPAPPSPSDLDRAKRIADTSPRADAHLALLGDKRLLFDDEDAGALLMYGVSGRSWVTMGDPLGSPESRRSLALRLRENADAHGGWPVFYEVGSENLPTYLDLGLSIHKLGEDARVPLADFSLEGSRRRGVRQVRRRCERAGAHFEVVSPEAVGAMLDELEAISNAWLDIKHTREKGFSLGAFDRSYLARQPVAVVRVAGRIVAFANVWAGRDDAAGGTGGSTGGEQSEISPDLMRYDPEIAPPSVMEYLFTELMLYGKQNGHTWFGLGMAPLAGLPQHRLAPTWNSLGSLLFRHGEHFYNFQGLRQYKAKFDPVWTPRYLASPGGLALPRVLADVASLVSGGLRGVIAR